MSRIREPLQPMKWLPGQTQRDFVDRRGIGGRCPRRSDVTETPGASPSAAARNALAASRIRAATASTAAAHGRRTAAPDASRSRARGGRGRVSAPSKRSAGSSGGFSMHWSISAINVASLYVAVQPVSRIATTRLTEQQRVDAVLNHAPPLWARRCIASSALSRRGPLDGQAFPADPRPRCRSALPVQMPMTRTRPASPAKSSALRV